MMADLLPGRLDAAVMSLVLARPYMLDKRLKGLAIDAAGRWSVIPDVPTLGELGLRDAAVAGWYGVAATPGTPRAIVQKLQEAFTTAARDPDLIADTNCAPGITRKEQTTERRLRLPDICLQPGEHGGVAHAGVGVRVRGEAPDDRSLREKTHVTEA